MKSEFILAINEIIEARALPREIILEALRTALVSAYRRDVSASSAQNIDVEFDMETGTAIILVEKEVVEGVSNPRTEVEYDYAKTLEEDAELGETIMVPVADTSRKFGRIAAQTAKQVILQKIREAERESLYEEYIQHEGDLISGTVQSAGAQGVTLSLGRAEAIMPPQHQMPGEHYRPRDKVRTYLVQVKKGNRGPQILVSRSHPNMLRRLLEYEVPEIYNGQVEIKHIAREAGHRSKVAVAALQEGVDPVGACVGMRGIRIQNIVRELNDEKIDVIEWNPDASTFITKALSPARVNGVYLDELADTGGKSSNGTATVVVPDDQLSLAIGREGQNARLAAKLTGWRIDIKSVTESAMEAVADDASPGIEKLNAANEELVAEVQRILAKRETNRPVMPEEFQVLGRYAAKVEDVLLQEQREVSRQYQEKLQAIRDKLPEGAFEMPINVLPLPVVMTRPLTSYFETVGELMTYLEADEARVRRALSRVRDEDALEQVRAALEAVEIPAPVDESAVVEAAEAVAEATEEAEEAAPEATVEAAAPEVVSGDEVAAEAIAPELEAETVAVVEEGEAPPAIIEPEPELPPEPVKPVPPPVVVAAQEEEADADEPEEEADDVPDFVPYVESGPEDLEALLEEEERQRQKARQRRRQLVYDEDAGEVISRRKRKASRRKDAWEDEIDI